MRWHLEARLLAVGPDGREVPVARSRTPAAVRNLGVVLIGEARAEARSLRVLEPLLGTLGSAEAQRVAAVLRTVTRGDEPGPLALVSRDEA